MGKDATKASNALEAGASSTSPGLVASRVPLCRRPAPSPPPHHPPASTRPDRATENVRRDIPHHLLHEVEPAAHARRADDKVHAQTHLIRRHESKARNLRSRHAADEENDARGPPPGPRRGGLGLGFLGSNPNPPAVPTARSLRRWNTLASTLSQGRSVACRVESPACHRMGPGERAKDVVDEAKGPARAWWISLHDAGRVAAVRERVRHVARVVVVDVVHHQRKGLANSGKRPGVRETCPPSSRANRTVPWRRTP